MDYHLISIMRDISQIFFFTTGGTVTLLTYLRAKKTLFLPIKTEVFKEQIKILSEILSFFRGKTESELRNDFAYEKLFAFNCMSLIDDYAIVNLEIDLDLSDRIYDDMSECPTRILTKEFLSEFMLDGNTKNWQDFLSQISDESSDESPWKSYIYGDTKIPKETSDMREILRGIIDSPLIPKDLLLLLEDYQKSVDHNIFLIADVLTEVAQELPTIYPTPESLEDLMNTWIWQKYIERLEPLENKAKLITDYLREYFSTDQLLEL